MDQKENCQFCGYKKDIKIKFYEMKNLCTNSDIYVCQECRNKILQMNNEIYKQVVRSKS